MLKEKNASSLGRKDPLEEGMATHSSVLAWRIPWTEEAGQPIIAIAGHMTSLRLSLLRTTVVEFRAHSDNLGVPRWC